jgi:hypothetical protein
MSSLFADESKSKRYLFGVISIANSKVDDARKLVRSLTLPGQRSLHFSKESDRRRTRLLSAMLRLEMQIFIIQTDMPDGPEGRAAALDGLMQLATGLGSSSLSIERDDSSHNADQKRLKQGLADQKEISFRIQYRHEEPMLWVADAVAWSFQRRDKHYTKLKAYGLRVVST